jgi:hypothetical protein
MNEFETYNYQAHLEEAIELRKAIAKLEDLLTKKHIENENLKQIYEDFKIIHERVKKENKDLNEKTIILFEDKKSEQKAFEAEIKKLKSVINLNTSSMKDKRKALRINY